MSLFFPSVNGSFGYNLFAAVYGFAAGGFHYSFKMHLFEMSKSRHFALVWSCLRGAQGVGVAVGVATFGLLVDDVQVQRIFGAIFFFAAAGILLCGDRCRQYRRYRKCPLHDVVMTNNDVPPNVNDAANDANLASNLKEKVTQVVQRKTSDDIYRAYFGKNLKYLKPLFITNHV